MPQGVAGASADLAPFAKQVPCAFAVGRPALLGDGFRRERVTLLSASLTGHSPPPMADMARVAQDRNGTGGGFVVGLRYVP